MAEADIPQYVRHLQRICGECGCAYTIQDYIRSSSHYFSKPYDYRAGCERYCLSCWITPGWHQENDEPAAGEDREVAGERPITAGTGDGMPSDKLGEDGWPYADVYPALMCGDILTAYEYFTRAGVPLAVLPISRVHIERPAFFPEATAFYPPGVLDLSTLGIVPNSFDSGNLAEAQSEASGVDLDTFDSHPLVVCPFGINWSEFRNADHKTHLEMIRQASQAVDTYCLDVIRFRLCRLDLVETLPGRAGQVNSDPMMAGMLLYNGALRESRIIGGAAFTHCLTLGLGLDMRQLEWNEFPAAGEAGQIVRHALSLYSSLLEAHSPTAKFFQAMTLLEFLAHPGIDEYIQFKESKDVLSRALAKTKGDVQRIEDRITEMTGKKVPGTKKVIGYRTRVVHFGEHLEDILPNPDERAALFRELAGYIGALIEHMIENSELSWSEYEDVRSKLPGFAK